MRLFFHASLTRTKSIGLWIFTSWLLQYPSAKSFLPAVIPRSPTHWTSTLSTPECHQHYDVSTRIVAKAPLVLYSTQLFFCLNAAKQVILGVSLVAAWKGIRLTLTKELYFQNDQNLQIQQVLGKSVPECFLHSKSIQTVQEHFKNDASEAQLKCKQGTRKRLCSK